MKNIFVLYTGGTIGMKETPDGLAPDTALAATALAPFAAQLRFDWHLCTPLIDSSSVTPSHWAEWLTLLGQKLPHYDGILVLHGTDSMAYTANLLALALDTLGKPVVITGSQKPYGRPGSDAPANLATAVTALLRPDLRQTVIAFNGRLFPAVGSSKCSTESDDGFSNTHFGTWQPACRAPDLGALPRRFDAAVQVCSYLLTPGGNSAMIARNLLEFPPQAAVLLSYGHGNLPADPLLLEAVRRFCAGGRLLLNISQTPQGRADATYAQSSPFRQAGAVPGGRCTIETATALMMLAAANRWPRSSLEQALQALDLT